MNLTQLHVLGNLVNSPRWKVMFNGDLPYIYRERERVRERGIGIERERETEG